MALVIIQLICFWRTGLAGFPVMGALTLALLGARLRLADRYVQLRGRFSPTDWARWFTWGGIALGCIWGATGFAAMHWSHDRALQIIVISSQAAWLAGLSVRNAVSPASVQWQSVVAMVPIGVAYFLDGDRLLQLASLLYIVQLSSSRGVSNSFSGQAVTMLLSEQAVAESNARLSLACAELEEANTRLQRLSQTDGLTGIGNRRAFDAALAGAWARGAREGCPVAILLLDVDLFKRFNDRYGHPAGDDCLRSIASIIQAGLREDGDFAGRYGGEEFVALLYGASVASAAHIARRMIDDVRAAGVTHEESPCGVVTVSVGVAGVVPAGRSDALELVGAADKALYRAKQQGRNRMEIGVVAAQSDTDDPIAGHEFDAASQFQLHQGGGDLAGGRAETADQFVGLGG